MLSSNKPLTFNDVQNIFVETNFLIVNDEERPDFPLSYEDGININTLMNGVAIHTGFEVIKVENNHRDIGNISNVYVIEQWQ